jgi:DnaJ-class molecular chaperone
MFDPVEEMENALNLLELPKLISVADIKKQYRFLAKKYHPDRDGDAVKMEQINSAYQLLMKYIEEFRYTFSQEEISKQFPGVDHAKRFRP